MGAGEGRAGSGSERERTGSAAWMLAAHRVVLRPQRHPRASAKAPG
jgi:hypothetical protein